MLQIQWDIESGNISEFYCWILFLDFFNTMVQFSLASKSLILASCLMMSGIFVSLIWPLWLNNYSTHIMSDNEKIFYQSR